MKNYPIAKRHGPKNETAASFGKEHTTRVNTSGKAYVMMHQEAESLGMIVTVTLTFNSIHLLVLFHFGVTHSFISNKLATRLKLSAHRTSFAFQ